jgi:hypothetical protein
MNKIPSPNQEALDLQKKMKILTRRAFAIHGQMAGLRHKIEEVCIHNEIEKRPEHKDEYISKDVCKTCGKVISRELCTHKEIERQHGYEPGGYLDRCVYINKDVCKVCGKLIHEEKILGGFG